MVRYPISVPSDQYRGANARKQEKIRQRNTIASRIETYINAEMAPLPENCVHVFYSDMIAIELREDKDIVREIVFTIDCGHNGVTVYKGDYETAIRNPK